MRRRRVEARRPRVGAARADHQRPAVAGRRRAREPGPRPGRPRSMPPLPAGSTTTMPASTAARIASRTDADALDRPDEARARWTSIDRLELDQQDVARPSCAPPCGGRRRVVGAGPAGERARRAAWRRRAPARSRPGRRRAAPSSAEHSGSVLARRGTPGRASRRAAGRRARAAASSTCARRHSYSTSAIVTPAPRDAGPMPEPGAVVLERR